MEGASIFLDNDEAMRQMLPHESNAECGMQSAEWKTFPPSSDSAFRGLRRASRLEDIPEIL